MNRESTPSRLLRRVIHEETIALPRPFNVSTARRAFSALFDRGAEAVFRSGHDLDDVLVDRLIVRNSPGGHERETEFELWVRSPEGIEAPNEDSGANLALRVRVILDRGP